MTNVQTEIKGDKLVITVDISQRVKDSAPLSASGKTHVLGTTNGFVDLQGGVKVGLNVIHKR